jgi:hypothetical protein
MECAMFCSSTVLPDDSWLDYLYWDTELDQ